jgi:hypothetical protein
MQQLSGHWNDGMLAWTRPDEPEAMPPAKACASSSKMQVRWCNQSAVGAEPSCWAVEGDRNDRSWPTHRFWQ